MLFKNTVCYNILTLLMMAIASRERNLGYRTSSFTIESNTSSSSSPGNGDSPTNISNIRTPSPHQSTALVYDVSVRTSGARNSGVPQNVPVLSPYPIPSLHRPKSAIFTYPSVSRSRLSSFKSLKEMFYQKNVLFDIECKYHFKTRLTLQSRTLINRDRDQEPRCLRAAQINLSAEIKQISLIF